jgi:hypothetical protein
MYGIVRTFKKCLISKWKKVIFYCLLEGHRRKDPESDPDPLVRGKDPRIRILTKSASANTGWGCIMDDGETSKSCQEQKMAKALLFISH